MSKLEGNEKNLVVSFIHHVRQKISTGQVTADQTESLEVAIQCIESAFLLSETDFNFHPSRPLQEIFDASESSTAAEAEPETIEKQDVSEEDKAKAEGLKNEGNDLMRNSKFEEALTKYSEAINLYSNAVYFCNRAASYSRMERYDMVIQDCRTALAIDPKYSKAYGRMGLALSCQNRYREAVDAYKKALEIEPDNESFKNNLTEAEDKLRDSSGAAQQQQQGMPNLGANPFGAGGLGGFDFNSMFSNPAMMQMASNLMSDPNMHNMMSNLVGGAMQQPGGEGGLEGLMRAGQTLAQQMSSTNPDLVDQLRNQFQGVTPSGNQNDQNQNGPPADGQNGPGNNDGKDDKKPDGSGSGNPPAGSA